MKAAVWHEGRTELLIEDIPEPRMLPGSVIVEVQAAFVAGGLLARIENPRHSLLPPQPFVPGLDTIGRVAAVADGVTNVAPGDPVYCDHFYGRRIAGGEDDRCLLTAFGLGPDSGRHLARWPNGGFAARMILPAECMVPLHGALRKASVFQLARLGWLGTAWGGFLTARLQPGETVIVSGASGQVGAAAVLLALALGVPRIVATGRRRALLAEIASVAPERVVPVTLSGDRDTAAIRDAAGGTASVMLDCIGYGAAPDATVAALRALETGGRAALVGTGFTGALPLDYDDLVYRGLTIAGSMWFPREAGHRMAAMIASGQLDLAPIEPVVFPLENAMEALREAARGGLGLRHVAIAPGGVPPPPC